MLRRLMQKQETDFSLPKFSHTTLLLCSLHWLPVAAWIRFKTLVLAYRAVNGSGPSDIQDMTPQPVLYALLLPNGLLLPRCEGGPATLCCLGSTVVEQAPYWHQVSRNTSSSVADWKLIRSDCTSAHEKKKPSISYLSLNVALGALWWFLQFLVSIHMVECTYCKSHWEV